LAKKPLKDRAIELAFHLIIAVSRVFRKRPTFDGVAGSKLLVCVSKSLSAGDLGEIKTTVETDYSPNHCRLSVFTPSLGSSRGVLGPLTCSFWRVLPEIDALTKPVPLIL